MGRASALAAWSEQFHEPEDKGYANDGEENPIERLVHFEVPPLSGV
jgi:hypothetical protein